MRRPHQPTASDYREGLVCPHCGDRGPHEDNGASGLRASYLCAACREIWDAETYTTPRYAPPVEDLELGEGGEEP
jgi:transposase-like protein